MGYSPWGHRVRHDEKLRLSAQNTITDFVGINLAPGTVISSFLTELIWFDYTYVI